MPERNQPLASSTAGLHHATLSTITPNFCGPVALSATLGLPVHAILGEIVRIRKAKGRLETDPLKIKITYLDELFAIVKSHHPKAQVMSLNNQREVWAQHPGHEELVNMKPTLSRWIKTQEAGTYLIRVGGRQNGHFLAIHRDQAGRVTLCDAAGSGGKAIPLHPGFRYNRSRVTHVIALQS